MAISVKYLLQGIFKQESWKLKLLSEWETIVGNLHDKMRLEKIDNDTLIIGVYQASWLQELHLLSCVLQKSINDHLGSPRIKHLRFKHASPKEKPIPKKVEKPRPEFKLIVLNDTEKKALAGIKDDQLKQALYTFLSKCHYVKIIT